MTRRHELRLTVPDNSHVEFDLPGEITGDVRIIVEPVGDQDDEPTPAEIAESLAIALELQRTSPVITADVTAMIREDRDQ